MHRPVTKHYPKGLLALLEEDEPQLKEHALKELIHVIDQHWAEVANKVSLIEGLSEDSTFTVNTCLRTYLPQRVTLFGV